MAYIVLFAVATCSFLLASSQLFTETISLVLASFPGVGSLLMILYKVLQDHQNHQKKIDLQIRQQSLNIGTASHMANVAFDKHAEFCEKYMRIVHEAIDTLMREGASKQGKAIEFSTKCVLLRQQFSAWLTYDINESLIPFEKTLMNIGADARFVEDTRGFPEYADDRLKLIRKGLSDFSKLLDITDKNEDDVIVSLEDVKTRIREILGIEELVRLRTKMTKKAIEIVD